MGNLLQSPGTTLKNQNNKLPISYIYFIPIYSKRHFSETQIITHNKELIKTLNIIKPQKNQQKLSKIAFVKKVHQQIVEMCPPLLFSNQNLGTGHSIL